MASKQKAARTEPGTREDRGHFWQPPEKRDVISEEGRKWLEENAEAIADWNDWLEKNGVPIPPQF